MVHRAHLADRRGLRSSTGAGLPAPAGFQTPAWRGYHLVYRRRLLARGCVATHAHTLDCGQIEPQLKMAISIARAHAACHPSLTAASLSVLVDCIPLRSFGVYESYAALIFWPLSSS